MSLCNQINVGQLSGSGRAKSGFKKAFRRAFREFNGKGRSACIGGTCGTFGSTCSFRVTSMNVDYTTEWGDGQQLLYEVTIDGTGECACE